MAGPGKVTISTSSPAPGWSKDGAGEPGAEEAQAPEGQGDPESRPEEEMAGAPQGLLRGGKSREPEPEDERLSEEWEDAKRWSKMDQLAKELTADKRPEGEDEDDPDRSMRLSFRPRGSGFGGPGPQLRRGWRPSSQEDPEGGLAPQGRSYPEEKKEEEGSANRRPEVGTGRDSGGRPSRGGSLPQAAGCRPRRVPAPGSLGPERCSDREPRDTEGPGFEAGGREPGSQGAPSKAGRQAERRREVLRPAPGWRG